MESHESIMVNRRKITIRLSKDDELTGLYYFSAILQTCCYFDSLTLSLKNKKFINIKYIIKKHFLAQKRMPIE